MLLYTLVGEEATVRLAEATGIADGLGYVPVRLCTPLDEGSLSRSWTKMASAWICDPEQIEVMTVNDDRCVPIDAVDLERALSAPERPDREAVRKMLAAPESECSYVLLPPRFEASMRLRMSTVRLTAGDLDDYATDESALNRTKNNATPSFTCSPHHTMWGVAGLDAGSVGLRSTHR